ncbi:MAG: hypothetical protein ACRDVM_06425, partial [Acidimicrobiia bacterium]
MSGGLLVLMGSGELAPPMVGTHREALARAGDRGAVMLDGPFGFQDNADQLCERIVEFFRVSLGVEMGVASLRRPDASALERERMLRAVQGAGLVFSGPGSPSYALRVWAATGLDELMRAKLAGDG